MELAPARHVVLTGAPGAGKTSLLEAAADEGFRTSHEVARALLRQPGGMALRRDDPLGFAEAMTAAHIAEFEEAERHGGLTVFDRGLPDVVGFLDVSGLAVPRAIDRACREIRYTGPVFRAPAWQAIYCQDSERIQDWEGAKESDAAVSAAWQRYGYALETLPLWPVVDRLDLIRARGAS